MSAPTTPSAPTPGPFDARGHWERVYSAKDHREVSWFQEHAFLSMSLIRRSGVGAGAAIVDVGGGASKLADDLIDAGYGNLTVVDLSRSALDAAKARLGARGPAVKWMEADLLEAPLIEASFDLWHDRAMFHFLTDPADRRSYARQVLRAVKPGGAVVLATFAEDGPASCSGLPTTRWAPAALAAELGGALTLVAHEREDHLTPSGGVQRFVYCLFRR